MGINFKMKKHEQKNIEKVIAGAIFYIATDELNTGRNPSLYMRGKSETYGSLSVEAFRIWSIKTSEEPMEVIKIPYGTPVIEVDYDLTIYTNDGNYILNKG